MANVLVEKQNLVDTANAIRQKLGSQETMTPDEMAEKVESIPQGGESGPDYLNDPVETSNYGVAWYMKQERYDYAASYYYDSSEHYLYCDKAKVENWLAENNLGGFWAMDQNFTLYADGNGVYTTTEWDWDPETGEETYHSESYNFSINDWGITFIDGAPSSTIYFYSLDSTAINKGQKKLVLEETDISALASNGVLSNGDLFSTFYRYDFGNLAKDIPNNFNPSKVSCTSTSSTNLETIGDNCFRSSDPFLPSDNLRQYNFGNKLKSIGNSFGYQGILVRTSSTFTLGNNCGCTFYAPNITSIGSNFSGDFSSALSKLMSVGVNFIPTPIMSRTYTFSMLETIPDGFFNYSSSPNYDVCIVLSNAKTIGNNCLRNLKKPTGTLYNPVVQITSSQLESIGDRFLENFDLYIVRQQGTKNTYSLSIPNASNYTIGNYFLSGSDVDITQIYQLFKQNAKITVGDYFLYNSTIKINYTDVWNSAEVQFNYLSSNQVFLSVGDYFLSRAKSGIRLEFYNFSSIGNNFLSNSKVNYVYLGKINSLGSFCLNNSTISIIALDNIETIPANFCNGTNLLTKIITNSVPNNVDQTSFIFASKTSSAGMFYSTATLGTVVRYMNSIGGSDIVEGFISLFPDIDTSSQYRHFYKES